MNCTRCGASLRENARFCGVCAHPTTAPSPALGQSGPAGRSSWLRSIDFGSTNTFLVIAGTLVFGALIAVGIASNFRGSPSPPVPTVAPPTAIPSTAIPTVTVPPTAIPATAAPPTSVPATAVAPARVPPTPVPPTRVPDPTRAPAPVVPARRVWPQALRDEFINSCSSTSGGRASYCVCALDKLQMTYTVEEFIEITRRYTAGIPFPSEVQNIIMQCTIAP